MNKKHTIFGVITLIFLVATTMVFIKFISPTNDDNLTNIDFLTPAYYSSSDESFKEEINQFLDYARMEEFHHPLENESGQIPAYEVKREFGDQIGPDGASQHHPAEDLHIGDKESIVNMYAVHDGFVQVYRDAAKYRHYLSITLEIVDENGHSLGKIVTIYAHIDLDLDESTGLILNNTFLEKGDLVSKNLYANTLGGPHLHFEIRYYRPSDGGNEDFYSYLQNEDFPMPTAGDWTQGYWSAEIGYGFANPKNHGLDFQ